MTIQKKIKPAVLASSIALALSPIGSAHAFDFKVNDTTATIYGYAKLDIFYDVDDKLGETSFRGKNARLDGEKGSDGHFSMQVLESRIGFKTSTPLNGSTLTTVIEGDFFSGGGGFRLRHAYGEWNGILAGQTWSNFGSGVAVTPLLDFAGTSGHALAHRQPQLRYTDGNFSFSIEDPDDKGGVVDARYPSSSSTTVNAAKSRFPDVTARYTNTSGAFKYSASFVGRYLEYDNTDTGQDDNSLGWGAGLEAAMDVTSALTLRAGVTYGDGIGGYINGNDRGESDLGTPGYVNVNNGDLEVVSALGATIGASLKAGPGSINVAYSRVENDFDDNGAPATYKAKNENIQELWVNYIWSPADSDSIHYGLEAGWHEREVVDGRKGDALRLQAMIKYSF